MNRALSDDTYPHDSLLLLFLTGEAPRSRRAQRNLSVALETTPHHGGPVQEVDLLREPQQAIHFGIFATPALVHIDASGNRRVLYGDLSGAQSLKDFLQGI